MPSPLVAIVDDDASVRRGLSRLLRSAGLQAATYASAAEFLGTGLSGEPACLVLDIHLGGMSGLELLSKLRAAKKSLPVVIITAHDNPQSKAESSRLGCAAYLKKPFEASELLQAVSAAIEGGHGECVRSAHPGGQEGPR